MQDPMAYGIQASVDASGKPVLPVIADLDRLAANRRRIGQPGIASIASQMGATILRIGPDGLLVGKGPGALTGIDAVDAQRARREPGWGLAAIADADAMLKPALAAAKAGNKAPMADWTRQADPGHRQLLADVLMAQTADGDGETAIAALRPALDGLLDGLPKQDDLRIIVGNALAYALVARPVEPTAEELARAVALAAQLDKALGRKEIAGSPLGHGIADTVACVRFRQGDRVAAAALWRKAITLAGKRPGTDLYQRRLAAAGSATAALPR
jgi:hypothetical protein